MQGPSAQRVLVCPHRQPRRRLAQAASQHLPTTQPERRVAESSVHQPFQCRLRRRRSLLLRSRDPLLTDAMAELGLFRVLEPLVLRRLFLRRAAKHPRRVFDWIERMHWVLLTLSLVTVAGAVAGSHGWLWL